MHNVAIPAAVDSTVGRPPRPGALHLLAGGQAGSRLPRLLAAFTAAGLAIVAHVAGMWRADIYPFGMRPWAVNDAYNQILPHKAYLRELLLHPGGPNSLLFNWHSALGMPYLSDFATYSASPFNLLLVLVPRDQLTIGVQLITLVQVGVAAAAMALVLLSLHRQAPWGIAAALGAGYAGCGWLTGDAIVVLSWVDGLVAFPVLLWAALRLVRRRNLIAPVLLVALFWLANYYTAVMATLGVGLVVVALVAVDRPGPREATGALGRVIGGFALGIAMISWAVLPVLAAVGSAAQVPDTQLYQSGWGDTLARFFPGNWSLGTAGVFVGTGTLALVAAIPWNRRLAPGARLTLALLPVLAVVSMQIPATQLAWHSFAVPNGSAYREAFVIAGLLAITAWLGLAKGVPGPWPLVGGAVTVAGLGIVLLPHLSTRTVAVTAASLVLVTAVAALQRSRLLAGVLLLTILVESAYTANVIYRDKATYHRAPTSLGSSIFRERLALVPAVPDGERTRVPRSSENDPLLLGYNGLDYYSSTIPQVTADAISDLGVYYSRRRVTFGNDDPAAQVLLGIHDSAGTGVNAPVTVLPTGPVASDPAAAGTVWAARDDLAGTRLYTVPAIRLSDPVPGTITVTARCEAGSILQVATHADDRNVTGTITWQDRTLTWGVPQVHTLGMVPSDGRVSFTIGGSRLDVRPGDVGCLDRTALDRVVTTSRSQAAEVDFGKERIRVSWPGAQSGDAVILTTAIPGWACRTDLGGIAPTSRAGMLTVPVQAATSLECNYRTPGLALGVGIAGGALALTVALEILRVRRRGRAPR